MVQAWQVNAGMGWLAGWGGGMAAAGLHSRSDEVGGVVRGN